MIKRLFLLTGVILTGLALMAILAHQALNHWQRGLTGQRLGQFAEVAEQIRNDVNHKLNDFLTTEQNRPYSDYLNYYVPTQNKAVQQQALVVRSPLVGQMNDGLAYGYFQILHDGTILTPNDDIVSQFGNNSANIAVLSQTTELRQSIRSELLPILNVQDARRSQLTRQSTDAETPEEPANNTHQTDQAQNSRQARRGQSFSIPAFEQQAKTQVLTQERMDYDNVIISNSVTFSHPQDQIDLQTVPPSQTAPAQEMATQRPSDGPVTIKVQPFTPVIVPPVHGESLLFGAQVYLIRHVQVDQERLMQGFRLNQSRLQQMIVQSAQRFMRDGMGFSLAAQTQTPAAFSALLDFGFGSVTLDLLELNPGWISHKAVWLRRWYFGVLGFVGVAICLGLFSLWQGTRNQLTLARQKDDFISAVSHELRTPLTSIRMYAEMLEKGWVKTEDKQTRYHHHIRRESERLSRLIENVLDFSRLQRGRKRFHFDLGNLNDCVNQAVAMMTPYANQQGFTLSTHYRELPPCRFDKDAVLQIMVNLIDNALKYARNAADKTIILRTRREKEVLVIEVEDHGPGVPHSQRQKIFQEFYRTEAEATREATGTGLGLALVKRFAEAHQGFVDIIPARPQGALFRVGLKINLP